MEENFKMVAKTFYGFEQILAKELRLLGAQHVKAGNRMVSFVGDLGFMYKANLCLRTALKILKPIHAAEVEDEEALYQLFYNFNWGDYLDLDSKFVIDSVVNGTIFKHSQFASQKAKDGLVDQFKDRHNERPSVDLNRPDLRINLHIQEDFCTISLDSSGASLHHRGYRTATNIAPLNEVLAAGLIQLSGWKGNSDFLDPMCGSGTLVIEAAMFACNIPANIKVTPSLITKSSQAKLSLSQQADKVILTNLPDVDVGNYQYELIYIDEETYLWNLCSFSVYFIPCKFICSTMHKL